MSNANSYIGVDLHKKTCFITVMNQAGKIKNKRRFPPIRIRYRGSLASTRMRRWPLNPL